MAHTNFVCFRNLGWKVGTFRGLGVILKSSRIETTITRSGRYYCHPSVRMYVNEDSRGNRRDAVLQPDVLIGQTTIDASNKSHVETSAKPSGLYKS